MIPSIIIQFERQPHKFQPLEYVSGTFRLVDVVQEDINHIEFSVLWFTEGKGDEDLGVHFFENLDWTNLGASDRNVPVANESNVWTQEETNGEKTFHFRVRLPTSPLSYYGKILKIHWGIRVRVFMKQGRDVKGERIFMLGCLPPVQVDLK